jgi:hypothetical protein
MARIKNTGNGIYYDPGHIADEKGNVVRVGSWRMLTGTGDGVLLDYEEIDGQPAVISQKVKNGNQKSN